MQVEIQWQNEKGEWNEFDTADINGYPISHAIDLFSFKVHVVAKQDGQYFVNTPELLSQYQKAGKPAQLISNIPRSDELFSTKGFGG